MKHNGIIERATRILPYELKSVLGYHYKKHVFFSYSKETFGARCQQQSPGPMPPPELIRTEALMHQDDLRVRAKPEWYYGSGYREAWTVLTMLEDCSFDLGSMRSVLEFG